jgi:hypothetical protein
MSQHFIYHIPSTKEILISSNPYKSSADKGLGEGDFIVLQVCNTLRDAYVLSNDWRLRFGYEPIEIPESRQMIWLLHRKSEGKEHDRNQYMREWVRKKILKDFSEDATLTKGCNTYDR